jgi:uncharacterized protein YyaL (SSP411 family)
MTSLLRAARKFSIIRQRSSASPASSLLHSTNTNHKYNHLSNQQAYKSTAAIEDDDAIHESETFLTGASSLYAEQMYDNYLQDPNSVHETWRKYFEDMDSGKKYDENSYNRPTVVVSNKISDGEAGDSHLAVSILSLVALDTTQVHNHRCCG